MRRSRFTVLAGTAALVLGTAAVPSGSSAASAPDAGSARYVVLMAGDPVATYDGGVQGLRATSPDVGQDIDVGAPSVRRYVDHLRDERAAALRRAGVEQSDVSVRYSYAVNGFAAALSPQEVQALSRQRDVLAVVPDRLRQPQTDNTPVFLGLTANGGPWASGIVGENVVVGVIDTGIWPEHPSFEDDGSFPALTGDDALNRPVPCEFGDTAYNPDDFAFTCNNKLLGARDMRITYKDAVGPELYNSARDDDGHGTHTASTAAGDSDVRATIFGIDRGRVSGIAPRARVVSYKACGEQGCFESDLTAAIEAAIADGVDVINYSIGGGAGLVGGDEVAFLSAADAGIFAATSAGNEGPGEATVGGPSSAPWVTSVAASTQDRTFEGAVTLGDGRQFSGASITGGTGVLALVDAADLGNELCLADGTLPASVEGTIVLCKRGENARVDKSKAVFEAGGLGMVLYDVDDTASLVTDNHWVPSVHINNTDGLAVKDYIAAQGDAATASIVAGERVPAQGSVMADFSSRGPNPAAGDVIKPDITAPGVNILAGNSPTPALGSPGELFQSISGTSMSSPHIAGIFALIRQEHPDWTAAMAKSAIMTTARQDVTKENGTTAADPFDFGAGHVRPGSTGVNSVFDPGLVYDAGLVDYVAFLCGAAEASVDPALCASLPAGASTDPSDLNYPSIGVAELAGTQRVTRTVTSVAGTPGPTTYTAAVQAPPGFDVTVTPSQLTLAPGESADFRVRITSRGTRAFGRWSFGSLTWSGGGYDVRSPIAVAASAFDAPAQIERTGTRGAAAFGVKFGYTGRYDAKAHGLVGRRLTRGSVAQDPDQTFDPAVRVGTTVHRFTVRHTAYMRWELRIPDNAVDLDVYLYRRGRQVASSTNGGTDEMVELRLPRPGVYRLYVHGWQTGAGRQPYVLRSWQVPRRTVGSLVMRREPAAAQLGVRRRVRATWAGLHADPRARFGAITHHRGNRVLGLTVVRVRPRP